MITQERWALCLGGASCVWDDVLAWEALYGRQWDGVVIAANDVGCHWPRDLHHWVSLHPNKFVHWKALRQNYGHTPAGTLWAQRSRYHKAEVLGVDRCIDPWPGGSSGMLAVQAAETVGCNRVILCGIPMTPTPHFAETTERFNTLWAGAAGHWKAWNRYQSKMHGWVKSMSGRTQELLGAPTLAWLLGE